MDQASRQTVNLAIRMDLAFGDCMFTTPMVRELARRHGPVRVCTPPKYRDAYHNLPGVELVEAAPDAHDFTPGKLFDRHQREYGPGVSLLDVPWLRAWELGLLPHLPHQPPILIPTAAEQARVAPHLGHHQRPLVAVECAYFSQQSWLDGQAVEQLLQCYGNKCRILWLSNQDYPDHPAVDRMAGLSRRECILALEHVDEFVTTGSGIFCGSFATAFRGRTVCLWRDEYYQYEHRLAQLNWRPITWVHNHDELARVLGG